MIDWKAGDVAEYAEDNVRIPVTIVSVTDSAGAEGTEREYTHRAFVLRAGDTSEPHYLTGDIVEAGEEFEVGVNVEFLHSPYRGWSLEPLSENGGDRD